MIAGRRAGPDLFALDARVASENLAVRAWGLGDVGQRRVGPQGLQLTGETAALSRITGGPDMGPTRIAGRLTQAKAGWRFAGVGIGLRRQPRRATAWLRRPDRWRSPRAPGNGTSAPGWPGPADAARASWPRPSGGAPKASFDGSRLADGRLLLRDLQVTGSGLKLDATGGRGLLGGLTFKGNAAVSNLAAARAGAAGSAQASWSAAQAKAGQPWTFSLDARGDKLATGYPELDRLLGGKPQLKAQASLQGRRLAVGSGQPERRGARAPPRPASWPRTAGSTFKLDWSAEGPFHAGPIEIAGKAKGAGAVTGTLAAPRADLLADLAADRRAAPAAQGRAPDAQLPAQARRRPAAWWR